MIVGGSGLGSGGTICSVPSHSPSLAPFIFSVVISPTTTNGDPQTADPPLPPLSALPSPSPSVFWPASPHPPPFPPFDPSLPHAPPLKEPPCGQLGHEPALPPCPADSAWYNPLPFPPLPPIPWAAPLPLPRE